MRWFVVVVGLLSPSAGAAQQDSVYAVGDSVAAAELVPNSCVEPARVDSLRRAGVTATVQLLLVVDTTGRVAATPLYRLNTSGSSLYDDLAKQTALTCRYRPGRLRGRPVRVWMRLPLRYN